jgi:hypothetical protein
MPPTIVPIKSINVRTNHNKTESDILKTAATQSIMGKYKKIIPTLQIASIQANNAKITTTYFSLLFSPSLSIIDRFKKERVTVQRIEK